MRIRDVLAFEVREKVGGFNTAAELPLQPPLEIGETGIAVEAGVAEELILAPGERGIEVSERVVVLLCPEEAGALEGGAIADDNEA